MHHCNNYRILGLASEYSAFIYIYIYIYIYNHAADFHENLSGYFTNGEHPQRFLDANLTRNPSGKYFSSKMRQVSARHGLKPMKELSIEFCRLWKLLRGVDFVSPRARDLDDRL